MILLAVIGVIGPRIYVVMAVLGVMISAEVYRVLLAVAQSVRKRLYVDAARVNGLGSVAVNLKHVLPGMLTTIAVQAAQPFGSACSSRRALRSSASAHGHRCRAGAT